MERLALTDAEDIDLDHFDRVIIAASIHMGHCQKALCEFAASYGERLHAKPSLLLSVCIAAAGHDAEDWKAIDHILAQLKAATGWTPGQVVQHDRTISSKGCNSGFRSGRDMLRRRGRVHAQGALAHLLSGTVMTPRPCPKGPRSQTALR